MSWARTGSQNIAPSMQMLCERRAYLNDRIGYVAGFGPACTGPAGLIEVFDRPPIGTPTAINVEFRLARPQRTWLRLWRRPGRDRHGRRRHRGLHLLGQ